MKLLNLTKENKTVNRFLLTITAALLISTAAFGMGGDKPGPHGGYITMPGTYHVELLDKGTSMRVFLLDISMKNPVIENSNVSLSFIGNESKKVNCKPEKKYFVCLKPKKDLGQYTEINLESVRNKVKGEMAVYKLPLHFDK